MLPGKTGPKLKINQTNRKGTRRFHTQADEIMHKPPSRLNLKTSERVTTKPKYLELNSKNTYTNYNPYQNIKTDVGSILPTRKTTFKLHTHKNMNPNKYLKTETDQYSHQHMMTTATNTKATTVGMRKYEIDGTAGKGTFGVVYEGHIKGTGQKIAIKKVLQDKRYKNRQLQILKMLKHPGVLGMEDHFMTYEGETEYLNVVMEYYSENLYQAVKRKEMNSTIVKIYTYQLLRGLNYLNMLSIAHRDIKPQNVLVDRVRNKVVICDFGSAKQLVKGEANLAYICSRCYRAPQLIFGATDYTSQIDVWSLGCVVVEMINGEPPFLGDSQIDQLFQIVKVLGTPRIQDALEMNQKYDTKELDKFPNIKTTDWKNLLKSKDPKLIDLITKMLCYSPLKRLSAVQAMKHPYFDDLRDQIKHKQLLIKVKQIPNLFDFSKDELNCFGQDSAKLLPKWHDRKQREKRKQSFGMGLGHGMGHSGNLHMISSGDYHPHHVRNQGSNHGSNHGSNQINNHSHMINSVNSIHPNGSNETGRIYGLKKPSLNKM